MELGKSPKFDNYVIFSKVSQIFSISFILFFIFCANFDNFRKIFLIIKMTKLDNYIFIDNLFKPWKVSFKYE